jgi:mono/diheme cytochrome c family protein
MPAFAWRLSDQQVADVVNFIRSSWGNQAGSVKVGDVEKLREDALKTTSSDDLGQVTQHN